MWLTVEPGNVLEGRFEAAQIDAAYSVWRWQVGATTSGGAQRSGIALTHDVAWREAMAAVEDAERADAVKRAYAEGEAAGAARERAAVVMYLRDHPAVADRRGGQQVDAGPHPAVRRWVLHEAVPDIEAGAHVGGEGS